MEKFKIAAVVTVYFPENNFVKNIQTYSNNVDRVFIIDNSGYDKKRAELISKISNSVYLPQTSNVGIARALNIAIEKAIENNYTWLLTMDQDSFFNFDNINYYVSELLKLDGGNIYQVSSVILNKKDEYREKNEKNEKKYSVIKKAITSGSFINLKLICKNGYFNEDLFIDEVDTEYCLRCSKNGFHLLCNNRVRLYHNIGELNKKYIFRFFKIQFSEHNYIRIYYIVRNKLYIAKKYKEVYFTYILKLILKILFFEKDKKKKLSSVWKGYFDFKKNRLGKAWWIKEL